MKCYKEFTELVGVQKDLDEYLNRLEEAEKEIIENLEKKWIYFILERAPGSVFWHEKGWLLFQRLVEYMRMKQRLADYKINTPGF